MNDPMVDVKKVGVSLLKFLGANVTDDDYDEDYSVRFPIN
jgi:hypothetical protein